MTRLILLDRDGVINHDSPEYVKDANEWVAIPGALEAIARLKQSGYLVAVCTNQAGIGRGILDTAALQRIHEKMMGALAKLGVTLDALRYCPHHPDEGCRCRKPQPGMILDTLVELGVSADDAIMVGDHLRDAQAAIAAGVRPVLVRAGSGAGEEAAARHNGVSWIADDLAAVVRTLTEETSC